MQQQAQIRPSLTAIREATELGCDMAAHDHSVSPDLDHAYRYADYADFRDANRERWEHSEQFVRVWQDRLFRLAEKEGNRVGLRLDALMSSWNRWYSEIVIPMQSTLWDGWEQCYDLPRRFIQATHGCGAGAASPVVREMAQVHGWDIAKLWGLPTEPSSEAALLCRSVAREALAEVDSHATAA